MTDYIKQARMRNLIPDWAWYQINEQSAQNNWIEQRLNIIDRLVNRQSAEQSIPQFAFFSEVKIK